MSFRTSAKYIKYINSNPESLAYQALEYGGKNQDESNILQIVHKFTPSYQVNKETCFNSAYQ